MKASTAYRLAAGLGITGAVMLVWLVMGVGVLGADGDDVDRIFTGVLAVGFIGALLSRSARGLANAMFAMAAAQALVMGMAFNAGLHLSPVSSVYELVGVNGIFIAMFAASGLLFWLSARKASQARD
jgi:hypothetical protein